jgi:WhiB family transcriptional regulator, redox-sensing transcriptional regulator
VSNLSRLPGSVADVWEWQLVGSCRNADASVFFAPDKMGRPARSRRELEAKAVCARCPVRSQCAAYALAAEEAHGIWGGFTEAERRRLLVIGWEDLADRRRGRVDVVRLMARLKKAARRGAESADDRGDKTSTVSRPARM